RRADIDVTPQHDGARLSAVSGTALKIHVGLHASLLAAKAGARDPAVGQSRRAVDSGRCAGADPDLDRLSRTQREARFGDSEPPRGTDRFARQQAPNYVERFFESRRTRPDVGAHRGEPGLTPAEPALHD